MNVSVVFELQAAHSFRQAPAPRKVSLLEPQRSGADGLDCLHGGMCIFPQYHKISA